MDLREKSQLAFLALTPASLSFYNTPSKLSK